MHDEYPMWFWMVGGDGILWMLVIAAFVMSFVALVRSNRR